MPFQDGSLIWYSVGPGHMGRSRCSRNEIQDIQWKSFVCSLFELTKFVVLRWRCQHHKMRILAGKHSCERMPWILGHLTSWTTGFLQETMPCLHAASTSCHHCHSTGMCEHFGLVEDLKLDLDYFGLVLQASLIFLSGSDSARSADFKEKGSRRRRSAQGVALRFLSRSFQQRTNRIQLGQSWDFCRREVLWG